MSDESATAVARAAATHAAGYRDFAELVEGLDAIVWEMDAASGSFSYVSRRATELLGYPIERWLTEPGFWSDVVLHPEDREWALELRIRAAREARDHAFEYRARTADGRTLWLRDLVRVEPGEAPLLRGVMVEITEQKRTEEKLRERERHAALAAEVGAAVAEGMPLREMLQRCAEAMVRHLDAAFARIWTLNEAEQLLELQASAGMYTHLDGPHGRVPVGAFKIGMIAEEKQPHLSNDVPSDPRVGDQEWARREGMVAFAGYPLLVAGRVVGVAAIFARHALAESTLDALRGVADRLGLVVERRRTERELRERERQLAEAQAIAHLGSWEWEVTADTVTWNDQLYRIFGLPPGTPITFESYLERIHPEDRELVASTVGGALENGRGYRFEHRILRLDGAVRCIASQAEVETDEQGRAVRLFGIAQDITELKEAADHAQRLAVEQAARAEAEAAQRRVTRILASITDAFFALDREWRFTYLNPKGEQLLQRSAEELVGRNVWEEFPDAVDATFYRMYHQAVEEQRTVEFQEFYPPLDAWLAVRAYPSEEGLAVYFRDITDQKRAEDALEYQSYVTRTITENTTAALFMMDEKGRCTHMNPAAEAMIGYTLEEIREIPLHDAIHHHHPDGRPYPMAECPIDRALPEDFSIRAHEDVFIRKDGSFFPVVCAASPIFREEVPVGTVVEVRDVTHEKEAQKALRQSEERFRSLIEATTAIVWTTSGAGEFEGEQPGWSAFTGQGAGEFTGSGWLEAVHPEDREATVAAWEQALATRTLYQTEHRVRRHDGEYRHMLVRGVPILDERGKVQEWVGIHTDITERKQMEERQRFLAEAGTLFSSSLDYQTTLASVARLAVPTLADWCAIDLLREDGTLQRVEVAHADPSKRQLALELEQRYPPDPAAPTGVRHVLRTGEPELVPEIPEELLIQATRDEEHLRIIRELGLRSYIVVPLIARGRTLGAITLVSAESGRRYGADDLEGAMELALRAAFAVDNAQLFRDLEQALAQVAAERLRLQELFQEAPAFIAAVRGPRHVFEMANPPYLQLIGHREVGGKAVAEALPEVVEQGFIGLLDRVYTTGEPFVGTEVPIMLQRQAGGVPEERYVNFVYQPIREVDGSISGIFVHGVDVTDQVRARQQVEEKAEELGRLARALERSNRDLDQFAYVTSHDLKAPLRGIANLSQWIEEDLGENVPAETREHLTLMRGRVHRMEGLIDGILQYSRAGRVRDDAQEVDVGALLDELIELLSPPEQVTIRVQEGMPSLLMERLPLQQVFMNLIGNSVKYNDHPDPRVEVGVREGRDFYEFSVADNGPGIAPEYHERIFGIFQTLHARDKVEGTGIGLSLVRKIVETRGGRVWVESEEGSGATFRFLWPKQPEAEE